MFNKCLIIVGAVIRHKLKIIENIFHFDDLILYITPSQNVLLILSICLQYIKWIFISLRKTSIFAARVYIIACSKPLCLHKRIYRINDDMSFFL